MERKKRQLLDAMIETFGNITAATKACGLARQTHYDWLDSDSEYQRHFLSVDYHEMRLDFYERQLDALAAKRHPTAIIFALKTQGKERGYVERTEIDHGGKVEFDVKIPQPEGQAEEGSDAGIGGSEPDQGSDE